MRVSSKSQPSQKEEKRKLGFPFAPFPAKKFMNLRGKNTK